MRQILWLGPAVNIGLAHRRLRHSYRHGTTATEFALTIPLIMLLAFACMDFGRIAHHDQIVSNAARIGAELGAMRRFTDYTRPYWEAAVQEAVIQEMQNLHDFNESELVYILTTKTDSDGIVRVSVDVAYPFRTVVTWPGLPSEVSLYEQVEYRQFR